VYCRRNGPVAPRLTGPLAVAHSDRVTSVPDVQTLCAAIPPTDRRLFVVTDQPRVLGWDLLNPDPPTGRRPALSADLADLAALLRRYAG
jgi:hypothetical protein